LAVDFPCDRKERSLKNVAPDPGSYGRECA
jgi:hypothetical protein